MIGAHGVSHRFPRPTRLFATLVVGGIVAGVISGCSGTLSSPSPDSNESIATVDSSESAVGAFSEEREEPLSFEIESAFNDGQLLHVLGSLESKAPLSSSEILVRVFGIKEGAVSFKENFPLEKILIPALSEVSTTLIPGKNQKFYFKIPVAGLTDYQVQLIWGEEARTVPFQKVPALKSPQLRFDEVQVAPKPGCSQRDDACRDLKIISALVINEGAEIVAEAPFIVGLTLSKERPLDLSKRIQEYTWNIQGQELDLKPGEKKLLRFALAADFEDKVQRLLLSKYGIRENWREVISPFVVVNPALR